MKHFGLIWICWHQDEATWSSEDAIRESSGRRGGKCAASRKWTRTTHRLGRAHRDSYRALRQYHPLGNGAHLNLTSCETLWVAATDLYGISSQDNFLNQINLLDNCMDLEMSFPLSKSSQRGHICLFYIDDGYECSWPPWKHICISSSEVLLEAGAVLIAVQLMVPGIRPSSSVAALLCPFLQVSR